MLPFTYHGKVPTSEDGSIHLKGAPWLETRILFLPDIKQPLCCQRSSRAFFGDIRSGRLFRDSDSSRFVEIMFSDQQYRCLWDVDAEVRYSSIFLESIQQAVYVCDGCGRYVICVTLSKKHLSSDVDACHSTVCSSTTGVDDTSPCVTSCWWRRDLFWCGSVSAA